MRRAVPRSRGTLRQAIIKRGGFMSTRIHITATEAEQAIAALRDAADENDMITPSAADAAVETMSEDVRRVVACDADGSMRARDAWCCTVGFDEVAYDLRKAADAGFEPPIRDPAVD
jgi:hypothetical protein